jgi:hypothetical protein
MNSAKYQHAPLFQHLQRRGDELSCWSKYDCGVEQLGRRLSSFAGPCGAELER